MKITPAHDFNDFEVGKRHDLPQISVLDVEGKISLKDNEAFIDGVPKSTELAETFKLHGVDRFKARKIVVERLEDAGLMDKIEPHTHMVPHGDRSNVVIEPFLTDQWYVNAKALAVPAIAAVREGRTNFVPKNWEKTYFDWMENIQPWCISRQLWWGHQIPAWYGPDGKVFVAETEEEAVSRALAYYAETGAISDDQARNMATHPGKREPFLTRDEDVLDTWFSSALWPFSTLGWPDETPEVERYYPTNALVTGFDIIFFWVARMMMMGLHFRKEVPFKDVYIHRLVRDEKGAKMSKSKGNVVDPLGIIDDFGADALRFTLARGAAQGHDIRLSPQTVENNRNFATKLWNAARFVEFNGAGRVAGFDPKSAKETLNRWIAHETAKAVREITAAIEDYRIQQRRRRGLSLRLERLLRLVCRAVEAAAHRPGRRGQGRDPRHRRLGARRNPEAAASVHAVHHRGAVGRGAGTEARRPARAFAMADARRPRRRQGRSRDRLADRSGHRDPLGARRDEHPGLDADPGGAGRRLGGNQGAGRPLGRVRQAARPRRRHQLCRRRAAGLGAVAHSRRGRGAAAQGRDRLRRRARPPHKEMQKAESDIARVDQKLNNPKFVANAAEDVVEGEREKREEAVGRRQKIVEALERLQSAT